MTVLTVVSTTRIALEDAEDVLMFLLVVLILSTKLWYRAVLGDVRGCGRGWARGTLVSSVLFSNN